MTNSDAVPNSMDAHTSFATALGAALTRSLGAAGAGDWQITTQAEKTESASPSVHYALTLEGDLAGQCFVTVSETDAAALTAGAPGQAPDEMLLGALQTACDGLAGEFLRVHGRVAVRASRTDAIAAGSQGVAQLQAAAPGAANAVLSLLFDPQLLEAFAPPENAQAVARKIPPVSAPHGRENGNLDLVLDVELNVTLRFGQRQLPLREVLDLTSGSVVELDRQVDEPVELILDGKVIARGEAVIVDGNYGIRVTEVLQPVAL